MCHANQSASSFVPTLSLDAGGMLGFIAGNLPGAAIGALGGSKLGAIRDAKGKAVYQYALRNHKVNK